MFRSVLSSFIILVSLTLSYSFISTLCQFFNNKSIKSNKTPNPIPDNTANSNQGSANMTQAVATEIPHYKLLAKGAAFQAGVGSALITASIWACWMVSVKLSAVSSLTSLDLALFRYATPGIVFAAVLYKARHIVINTPVHLLLGICFGAGLPFFMLGSTGMKYAPISHAGLIIVGTMPLFVTTIAVIFVKETLSKQRFFGLSAISIGIVLLLGNSLTEMNLTVLKGDLFFLAAGLCWSVYTVCLRLSSIPPLAAASLFGLTSTLIIFMLHILGISSPTLFISQASVSIENLIVQFGIQGILVGLVTGFTYGFAIQRIGAENTTAVGAVAPVFAMLVSIFIFSDIPNTVAWIAMVSIVLGVVLASGIKLRAPANSNSR